MSIVVLCISWGEYAVGASKPETSELAAAETPRVVWVNPADNKKSPQVKSKEKGEDTPEIIWQDDFDSQDLDERYYHVEGERSSDVKMGVGGSSLMLHYPAGEHGIGGRKLLFGDAPFGNPIHPNRKFNEVYWRVYLFHPADWRGGGPDKLSRVTSFVSKEWNQASILHVWDGSSSLTLDPVSGVQGAQVLSKTYNDFGAFRWLGNWPESTFALYGAERGRWVSVEAQARLNTPGQADGYAALWIDGLLETERKNLVFRGSYTAHGLNALFLEAYSNKGLAVTQSRYLDNFVVSTHAIGPILADSQPLMLLRLGKGSTAYQVQLGSASGTPRSKSGPTKAGWSVSKNEVVWQSQSIETEELLPRLVATKNTGQFSGASEDRLVEGVYVVRVRQRVGHSNWSSWSPWHQAFRVGRH